MSMYPQRELGESAVPLLVTNIEWQRTSFQRFNAAIILSDSHMCYKSSTSQ